MAIRIILCKLELIIKQPKIERTYVSFTIEFDILSAIFVAFALITFVISNLFYFLKEQQTIKIGLEFRSRSFEITVDPTFS